MTDMPIPPGHPGHGGGTASIRRKPVRIDDDGRSRFGYTDLWELICPACGDPVHVDYSNVPAEAQKTRGPYPDRPTAEMMLEVHIGLENDNTRLARELGLA